MLVLIFLLIKNLFKLIFIFFFSLFFKHLPQKILILHFGLFSLHSYIDFLSDIMKISLTFTFQSENNSPLCPVKVFWLGGFCATSNTQNKAATPGEMGDVLKTQACKKLNGQPPVCGTKLYLQPFVISRTRNTTSGPVWDVQSQSSQHPKIIGGCSFK